MQEVTVGGQSILEAREGGTREEPEEAAGGKFFSVTHLTVSWRATGKVNWFALFGGKRRKTIPVQFASLSMESYMEETPLQKPLRFYRPP